MEVEVHTQPVTADLARTHHQTALRVVCVAVDLVDGGVVPGIIKRIVDLDSLVAIRGLVRDLIDLCTVGCGGRWLGGWDCILVAVVSVSQSARLWALSWEMR